MKLRESELEFDFSAAQSAEKLDNPACRLPHGMQLVDFVVEEDHRLVMVEVKDPSCQAKGGDAKAQAALERSRAEFIKKLSNDTLIAQELTPKARDSYTWLHLMKRDTKPVLYVFVLGVKELTLEPALLLGFKDKLLAKLRWEAEQPWARRYVTDCLVLTETTWASAFPHYPLLRLH
jgi:hypothetical protein